MALASFLGFINASVPRFSLRGCAGVLPPWNYNYLSCLSNSSMSTHMQAGTHTHKDTCEVSRNPIVFRSFYLYIYIYILTQLLLSSILLCVCVLPLATTKEYYE